jgi:hypothetical protein
MTVSTTALLGMNIPPGGPWSPSPPSPLFAMWLALVSLMMITVGLVGKRTQRQRLAYCTTLGLVLIVAALAMTQGACANQKRAVTGPYLVTVTGTSGALSHSSTVVLNVTK